MTLDTLKAAVAWLSVNIDPVVPRALLVLSVLVVVYMVRKLFPRAWEAFAGVVPVPVIDAAPVLLVLSKFWQALPGTVLGMVTLSLSTGGDARATVKGAVFGAFAALAHEVLKAVPWIPYQGKVGDSGLPPGAGGSSGPKPTRIRATGSGGFNSSDAAMVRWGALSWRIRALMASLCAWMTMAGILCLAVVLQGCGAGLPKNPQHPDPACSDEKYAALLAACATEAATCVAKGGAEETCGALCDDDAAAWQERCQ